MKRTLAIMLALLLVLGGAWAHENDEAGPVEPAEYVAQGVALLRAEPPDLMEAQERLEAVEALESSEEVNLELVRAASTALAAGATAEAVQLLERSLGREAEPLGPLVEVTLSPAVYWGFASGLLLVGLGAYGLGRRAARETRAKQATVGGKA